MCLSPEAFVEARVTQRLLDAGVPRRRAEAVGRKVAQKYRAKRQSRLPERAQR